MEELSNLRGANGHSLHFEDLLTSLEKNCPINEQVIKSAGLAKKELTDPFSYERLFSEFTLQLAETTPIGRYVRHAAQYLRSRLGAKSSVRKRVQ
jgi:hypothetical protein